MNARNPLRRTHRKRARRAPSARRAAVSLLAFAALVVSLLVSGMGATALKAAAATCGTTNVALNKTATASSTENGSFPASAAVDGNTGTRWSSAFSDPQWLEVDLGSSQTICQVGLDWETAYAKAFQIQVSTDNTNWTTIYSTTAGTGGNQTLSVTGTGRYIRMYGTTRATQYGYSLWEFQAYSSSGGGTGGGTCAGGSNTPNLGPNTYIFTPSMSATTINNTLNTIFNAQKTNQFGTQRYAELFMPGTYNGVEDNVGYYTTVQGLGQNPDQVSINGDVTLDSFDGTGNATQNFWRSAENMEVTPSAAATAGQPPRPRRSSGWTSTAAWSCTRPPTATPAAATSPTTSSPGRRPACPSSSTTPRTARSGAGAARCGTWCSPA